MIVKSGERSQWVEQLPSLQEALSLIPITGQYRSNLST